MSEFMEQPWLIVGMGTLLVVMLVSGWIKTGNAALLPASLFAALLFGGLLLVERLVETDREQVKGTLYEVVAHVENNDADAVLEHIHSGAQPLKEMAASILRTYNFAEARVTRVKSIEVEPQTNPPQATVEFTARARLEDTADQRSGVRFVILHMSKEADQWRIVAFEHRPFQEAFQKSPGTNY